MEVKTLGYLGVRATSAQDWADFAGNLLGMAVSERHRGGLALRMDDRRRRIHVEEATTKGFGYFGWEVADAAALDRVAARLDRAGVRVETAPRALADQRGVAGMVVTSDPSGHRLELFHGAEIANDAFTPGRPITGFRTGKLGLGHVVLNVGDFDASAHFYRDLLGFKLTDYFLHPFPIYFLHVNSRHHSLALVKAGVDSVHHMMVETRTIDDVGQGYDLAQLQEGLLAQSLGRHINDQVLSFYCWNPSGFMLEYGWGGRRIPQRGWQPEEVIHGPSMWGHERHWMSQEGRSASRELRLAAARAGVRAPINVLPGTYKPAEG